MPQPTEAPTTRAKGASFIALLRGINVGGKNLVAMADLRALAEEQGFAEPRTVLQSGNLVFAAARGSTAEIEARFERAAAKRLRLEIEFFVRTAAEWAEAIAGNPFREEAKRDPARLVLLCAKREPRAAEIAALRAAIVGRETVEVRGRHAWVVYPDGQGTSKFTNARIERALGTSVTARNWNTVLKLAALAGA